MLQLPLAPSPLSLPPFDIDYRKSISAACHMLICPVYGPTSFVRTFFVLSLLGRTGCLFMPFNKFTLPAAVPNTCLLPLLLLLLCLLYMPTNAILSCPTQHHMHLKLATPPLRLWNHYNSNCKRKSLMQSRILSRASLGLLSTKLQDPLSLSMHSLLKLRKIFHFMQWGSVKIASFPCTKTNQIVVFSCQFSFSAFFFGTGCR